MLRLEQACLQRGARTVVDALSLHIMPGRLTVIVGPNGAGKSSALGLLSGRLQPQHGAALLDDVPLSRWSPRALAQRRAVLSQRVTLGFGFRAIQVVLLGRSPHLDGRETPEDLRVAAQVLERVGAASLAQRNYLELSGGEQQRVQLARVLAQVWTHRERAGYLLLDEPEAGLDIAHQHQVLRLAASLAREGFGIAAVLHDLNLAARYADEIAVLSRARLVSLGPPDSVLVPDVLSEVYGLPLRRTQVDDTPLIVPA